jgi:hypothetical protein
VGIAPICEPTLGVALTVGSGRAARRLPKPAGRADFLRAERLDAILTGRRLHEGHLLEWGFGQRRQERVMRPEQAEQGDGQWLGGYSRCERHAGDDLTLRR